MTNAQCIIGTENDPDTGILFNYGDEYYSQGYVQIKEAFRAVTEDDILQPYPSAHDFTSTKVKEAGEDNYYVCFFYMFSIYDIKQISQLLSQIK